MTEPRRSRLALRSTAANARPLVVLLALCALVATTGTAAAEADLAHDDTDPQDDVWDIPSNTVGPNPAYDGVRLVTAADGDRLVMTLTVKGTLAATWLVRFEGDIITAAGARSDLSAKAWREASGEPQGEILFDDRAVDVAATASTVTVRLPRDLIPAGATCFDPVAFIHDTNGAGARLSDAVSQLPQACRGSDATGGTDTTSGATAGSASEGAAGTPGSGGAPAATPAPALGAAVAAFAATLVAARRRD